MKKLVVLLALLLPVISFAQLDFTVEYVKHIKGYPVFAVRVPSHFTKMNQTREYNGSDTLVESDSLNQLALKRGIFAFEYFDYINDDPMSTDINYHVGAELAENYGANHAGAGLRTSDLKDADVDFVKARIDPENDYYKSPGFTSMLVNKGERYNNSPGHLENRIDKKHKEYGNCFLVTFIPAKNHDYDPKGEGLQRKTIPTMVMIHYEVFK
jgi:hypothetical protein